MNPYNNYSYSEEKSLSLQLDKKSLLELNANSFDNFSYIVQYTYSYT